MSKGLLVLTFPLLIFIGLRWHSAPFFSVKEYRCIQGKELLSDDYFSCINARVTELLNSNFSADTVIAHLKQEFSVLNKITVAYRPSAVHITVYPYEPVCCINGVSILASHNQIYPQDIFSLQATQSIPVVAVVHESMPIAPELVSSLLHTLPCHVDQTYTVELMNEHDIRLVDKSNPHFVIMLTSEQEKSALLLTQCELVKKNIEDRRGFSKGVIWVADTRFAHYIVVYQT